MTDSKHAPDEKEPPEGTVAEPDGTVAEEAELERLRRLILGLEQDQIREILERLDNPDRYAAEIGTALPAAIIQSLRSGPQLERALAPALEKATGRAIRRDTKAFAGALFPVMGPAIRRAIGEALSGLVQSINQALQHSLSVRGLRWRWEAARTGRPFAEVVLSKTLVYRVEQVLLIDRVTGLLLAKVVAPEVEADDADLVSGMLTAIQDFVRDSFQMDEEESLQTMEVGDLQVWVETGPRAVLAAAVRGQAPVELRQTLREALETIHLNYTDELEAFDGDDALFDAAAVPLEECLQIEKVEPSRKVSPLTWMVLALGVVVVAAWLWSGWTSRRQVDRFVEALHAEPGIVVTEIERSGRRAVVRGMRDPLAREPAAIAGEHELAGSRVETRFESYHALEGPFVLERANQILQPPPAVDLELADGELTATGHAGSGWVERARAVAPLLPGVAGYDDRAVEVDDPQVEARRRMAELEESVESHVVRFAIASAEIDEQEGRALEALADEIVQLVRLTESTFQVVRIEVEGHADPTGMPELNVSLSRDRASAVTGVLVARGVPEQLIQPVGRGALIGSEVTQEELEMLRKVTFTVEVSSLGGSRSVR